MGWDADLAAVDQAAASYFDTEMFTVQPMRRAGSVNSAISADPERQGFTFSGSIDFNPPSVQPGFLQQNPSGNRESVMHEAVITASMLNWPSVLCADDRIRHEGTGVTYQIAARPRDDSGRAVLLVSRAKI